MHQNYSFIFNVERGTKYEKIYRKRIIKARRKYAMLLDPLETRATLGYARLVAGDCYRPPDHSTKTLPIDRANMLPIDRANTLLIHQNKLISSI